MREISLIWWLLTAAQLTHTVSPQLPFDACSASSVNKNGSLDEFVPSNALSPGLDFWSSDAGVDSSEEIIWTGTFKRITELKGLEITWAMPPQQVKIVGSSDELTGDHVILNWQSSITRATTSSAADSSGLPLRSTERLDFPKGPEALKQVKIVMKGLTQDFIAIQQVRPIGADEQIFMLINGIQSPQKEQCLLGLDRTVTVDDCLYSIAHGDGRDVWLLTRSGQLQSAQTEPAMCVHYQSLSTGPSIDDVYSLSLHACAESDSRFDYMPNGQMKAAIDRTNLCLVALGRQPGFKNLLDGYSSGAEASTTVDVEHDANNALTTTTSYWCSTAFDDCAEHNVYWQFDLGNGSSGGVTGQSTEGHLVEKVVIDWEYAPLAYSILTSSDGISFQSAVYNPANPHNKTIDDLVSLRTRFVRVAMHKPHPLLGKIRGAGKSFSTNQLGSQGLDTSKYGYGIKNIQILQNNLVLSLKDCAKAAQMRSVGDKWFMNAIRDFDAASAKLLKDNTEFDDSLKMVQDSTGNLYDALPAMQTCAKRATDLVTMYQKNIQEALPSFQQHIQEMLQKPLGTSSWGALATNPLLGMSLAAPLNHGCGKKSPIGFYYLFVPCSTAKIMRLFCTADGDGLWLYEGTRLATRKSTLDLEKACAADGLRPAAVRSLSQFDSMMTMLSMKNVSFPVSGGNIPIAFDLGCDTVSSGGCMEMYYDLGSFTEVTGILSQRQKSGSPQIPSGAALAITSLSRNTPVEVVGWYSSKQIGFMCGFNENQSNGVIAKLDCCTSGLSPIFQGGRNTFFRVTCPSNCVHSAAKYPIYGGREGVYADRSSVCLAAIHRGIVNTNSFIVALESAHVTYPSIIANGLSSTALSQPTSFAFRVMDVEDRCPASELVSAIDASSSRKLTMKPAALVVPPLQDWEAGKDLGKQKASTALLNQSANLGTANSYTINQWSETQALLDNLIKVDGLSITFSRQTSMNALIEGRATIKPIETSVNRFTAKSDNLYMELNLSVRRTLGIVSAFFTKLEDSQQRFDQIMRQRNRIDEFQALPEGKSTLTWSLGSSVMTDRPVIKVSGSVEPLDSSAEFVEGQPLVFSYGSYLTHRTIYFYDGSFSIDVRIKSSDDVAMIGWRVKKASGDGYWLLVKQSKTAEPTAVPPPNSIVCKLILKAQSKATVLSHWVYSLVQDMTHFNVDIQVTRGRHTVAIEGKPVIDLIDELYSSGHLAFGIYQKTSAGTPVEFDSRLAVPNCCQRSQRKIPAPHPTSGRGGATSVLTSFLESPTCFRLSDATSQLHPSALVESPVEVVKRRNYLGRPTAYEVLVPSGSSAQSLMKGEDNLIPSPAYANREDWTERPTAIFFKPKGRPQECSSGTFSLDIMFPEDCPNVEIGPVVGESDKDYQWLSISKNGITRHYRIHETTGAIDSMVLGEAFLSDIHPSEWYSVYSVIDNDKFSLSLFNKTGKVQGRFAADLHDVPEDSTYIGVAARGCHHVPFARLKVSAIAS